MLVIEEVKTEIQLEAIRKLLIAYAESRGFDAALGAFDEELAKLPGKYGRPDGQLLIATWEDIPAGCVAYQKIGPVICEMKRMYVDPKYRAKGIGKKLVQELLNRAKEDQYQIMRLDTHPVMKKAQALYQSMGFTEIERYNKNPIPGIRFFELKL